MRQGGPGEGSLSVEEARKLEVEVDTADDFVAPW